MKPHDRSSKPAHFPSPAERERIIRRREALSYALAHHIMLRESDPKGVATRRQTLIRNYGVDEVQRMLDRQIRQMKRPTGDAEEPWLYEEYVKLHRRFGGMRPLLSFDEQRQLNYERGRLKTRQDISANVMDLGLLSPAFGGPLSAQEERRLAEITDVLMADADLWDDLVPEDPPPARPATLTDTGWQERLMPPRSLEDQLGDLLALGGRLFRERKTAAACDLWLAAWAIVRQLARAEHRSAAAFSRAYGLALSLDNWAVEVAWELGNAGIDSQPYWEQQLRFSREYLAQFPDEEPDTVVNMLRAQGEALWQLGRRGEAEETYAALVARLPDEGWGYIGWADQYWWLSGPQDAPPEYAAGAAILTRALARPTLADRADVLERLAELYAKWGKPAEQARAEAQLAKLRRAPEARAAPGAQVAPRVAPARKPGRNAPCWCGSGRKYKHCHLYADEAR